ncbi:MAG: DUF2267 domain-containing protein [Anaerolineae bacterium]|nr:DUF2267 domain-containing protein [Anaerolineae bacterium]
MTNLQTFYQQIKEQGHLRTLEHAQRWCQATLNMLGVNLDGRTKKALAKALPEELARPLTRVFWLLHFRNSNLPAREFQRRVGLRAGNTDWEFARLPIIAVFAEIKKQIDRDLQDQVAKTLAPEIRQLWQQAGSGQ